MAIRDFLLAACLFAAAVSGANGADVAYAHNYLTGSKQIVAFPVGNPSAMAVIGALTDTLAGMDFNPGANVLWAINFTAQTVGTIDRATGAYSMVSALQGGCCISAFTIDPVAGTFYVSKGDDKVYSLDPASGTEILHGAGAPPGAYINALGMDCSGRLIAASAGATGDGFYEVHPGANPTLIGYPGLASATSLEFDNDTGALYAWFNPSGSNISTYARIDPVTAQASISNQLVGKFRMATRNTCFRIFTTDFEA